ncbi:MAG: hypothetical protein OHK0046_45700 [Anaerolineae bacterium]
MYADNRVTPDGLLFVMAYLVLLGLAAVFSGGVILVISLPATLDLGPFFRGGAAVLALMGTLCLLLGMANFYTVWELRRHHPRGRAGAMLISALLLLITLLGTPLFVVEDYGLSPIAALTSGILLGAASAVTLRYLMQPQTKLFFYGRAA